MFYGEHVQRGGDTNKTRNSNLVVNTIRNVQAAKVLSVSPDSRPSYPFGINNFGQKKIEILFMKILKIS